jgi:hypothetical protein
MTTKVFKAFITVFLCIGVISFGHASEEVKRFEIPSGEFLYNVPVAGVLRFYKGILNAGGAIASYRDIGVLKVIPVGFERKLEIAVRDAVISKSSIYLEFTDTEEQVILFGTYPAQPYVAGTKIYYIKDVSVSAVPLLKKIEAVPQEFVESLAPFSPYKADNMSAVNVEASKVENCTSASTDQLALQITKLTLQVEVLSNTMSELTKVLASSSVIQEKKMVL